MPQATAVIDELDVLVERLARAIEATGGMPRIAGRIVALLLIEEGPFPFEEFESRLQVSRASISTNTRLLEQRGAIQRTSLPGDRRDYFVLTEDPFTKLLESGVDPVEQFAATAEAVGRELPERFDNARRRLESAAALHRAVANALSDVLTSIQRSHR